MRMTQIRAALHATAMATLMAVSACIPITLRTERVEPTIVITALGPDWNPWIGADARLKFVSDIRHAILAARPAVEFVEPDALWREAFQGEQAGSQKAARDLLDALNGEEATRLELHCLIVLGPQVVEQFDPEKAWTFPFYSSGAQQTSVQAVILRWPAADDPPRRVESAAQGMQREGWFPGTPLMFTRLYKKVDTDEAAVRGLVKALLAALPAERADGPLRLSILAEREGGAKTTRK